MWNVHFSFVQVLTSLVCVHICMSRRKHWTKLLSILLFCKWKLSTSEFVYLACFDCNCSTPRTTPTTLHHFQHSCQLTSFSPHLCDFLIVKSYRKQGGPCNTHCSSQFKTPVHSSKEAIFNSCDRVASESRSPSEVGQAFLSCAAAAPETWRNEFVSQLFLLSLKSYFILPPGGSVLSVPRAYSWGLSEATPPPQKPPPKKLSQTWAAATLAAAVTSIYYWSWQHQDFEGNKRERGN